MVSIAAPTSSIPACVSPTALATSQGRVARSLLPPPSTKCIMASESLLCEVCVNALSIRFSTKGLTSAILVVKSAPIAEASMCDTSPISWILSSYSGTPSHHFTSIRRAAIHLNQGAIISSPSSISISSSSSRLTQRTSSTSLGFAAISTSARMIRI